MDTLAEEGRAPLLPASSPPPSSSSSSSAAAASSARTPAAMQAATSFSPNSAHAHTTTNSYSPSPSSRASISRESTSMLASFTSYVKAVFGLNHEPGSTGRRRRAGRSDSGGHSFGVASVPPRLLDRAAPFHQSRGRLKIQRRVPVLLQHFVHASDWFHSLLDQPTHYLLAAIFSAYLLTITVWAGLWWSLSGSCNLNFVRFVDAMYMSLTTIATIGYGAPDIYFNSCPNAFFVICSEYFIGICLDACCIGLIFSRLARAPRRGRSLCLSDKAVMVRIRGQWHFMVQLVETRRQQAMEAHVRLYAVRHVTNKRGHTAFFQTTYMKLQHPNDDLGGYILTDLPSILVHRVDAWSPLIPTRSGPRERGEGVSNSMRFPEIFQRAADYDAGNRGIAEFDIEPRTPEDVERGARLGLLPGGSLCGLDPSAIRQFWRESKMEVVVVVEAIDATSSSSFQKRHSYTVDDIEWEHLFVSMVTEGRDGECVVDYSLLHDVKPVEEMEEEDMDPIASVL